MKASGGLPGVFSKECCFCIHRTLSFQAEVLFFWRLLEYGHNLTSFDQWLVKLILWGWVPPQGIGVHSSYGRGWMKTTTRKIWRCRKWLVCTDRNIPFSSVIITSHGLLLKRQKDGISSSSSEPLSCMGINSKGAWQRFSFFIKYPAEFLLYFFPLICLASLHLRLWKAESFSVYLGLVIDCFPLTPV